MEGPLPKVVFYTLTYLSIAVMAWQFLAPLRQWSKGRKITWKPAYLRNVLTYVAAQRKVMGSRPKSGAPLHLLVFYGFLGLFGATTLLALATYAPLLGIANWHKGTYYLLFEAVFDAAGLAFLAGIAWAFFRRYTHLQNLGEPVPDPHTGKLARSPNPVTTAWQDFATLALLFLVGLTGFVIEAARISADPRPFDAWSWVGYSIAQLLPTLTPQGYVVLWWVHMVWVWAFFIVLPKMRLRHVLMAVLSAAGSPETPMGRLPVVADLESPGVAEPAGYSRWHLLSLDACMSCGRCTEVCPAYGSGKPLNPKQVVQDVHRALRTDTPVATIIGTEELWACTTCNACVEACPVLIRHVDLIVDARRNLVAQGALAGTASVVLRQTGATGSAWGQAPDTRETWMAGQNVPLARENPGFEYLFWVGCAGSTDPAAIRVSKAVVSLLNKAGVSFACLGQEETCTGDPARRIGDEATYQTQADRIRALFQKYSVKKVLTACPHCFNSLLNELDMPGLQVEHHTQVLARLIEKGSLAPARATDGSIVYHDPCYLARVNNVSDSPRAILGAKTDLDSSTPLFLKQWSAKSTLLEPGHHGKKTLCCGAGGGRMWMEEEPDQRPGNIRAKELLETGASEIAVACPFCRIMLDASVKQVDPETQVRLVDLAEKLAEANP